MTDTVDKTGNNSYVSRRNGELVMNGIDYGTLLGNSSLFQQSDKVNGNNLLRGKVTGAAKQQVYATDAQDSVEISGKSREIQKAGYERPKAVVRQSTKTQEADSSKEAELSDAAKKLLEELWEKYTNMDFHVTSWTTEEEEAYYAGKCEKDYSVLIDPALLEDMAADEEVRAKYEGVLSGASEKSETLREELGEDAEKIENFTIAMDADGNISYIVQLVEDFAKQNKVDVKEQQEEIKESRKVRAESMEELIASLKERLADTME